MELGLEYQERRERIFSIINTLSKLFQDRALQPPPNINENFVAISKEWFSKLTEISCQKYTIQLKESLLNIHLEKMGDSEKKIEILEKEREKLQMRVQMLEFQYKLALAGPPASISQPSSRRSPDVQDTSSFDHEKRKSTSGNPSSKKAKQ